MTSDGSCFAEGFDVTVREWYSAVTENEAILTKPYVDSATGNIVITVAAPVYGNLGKIIGVVGLDIALNQMNNILSKYQIGEEGFVMLLGKQQSRDRNTEKDNFQCDSSVEDDPHDKK